MVVSRILLALPVMGKGIVLMYQSTTSFFFSLSAVVPSVIMNSVENRGLLKV